MSEIVNGMNQTSARVLPSDLTLFNFNSAKQYQQFTRANGDALLQFGLDYVNKYVMYNRLFNE